jgi:hypothetical protein
MFTCRKSVEGLSVRSVFFNVFQNLIVMLYVFDNDTNTVIRSVRESPVDNLC